MFVNSYRLTLVIFLYSYPLIYVMFVNSYPLLHETLILLHVNYKGASQPVHQCTLISVFEFPYVERIEAKLTLCKNITKIVCFRVDWIKS